MKFITSVLPNFIKSLTIVLLSTLSFSVFAAHHGDAEEKADAATDMVEETAMEMKDGDEASELTDEEKALKKKKYEAKMKMKKEAEKDAPE